MNNIEYFTNLYMQLFKGWALFIKYFLFNVKHPQYLINALL